MRVFGRRYMMSLIARRRLQEQLDLCTGASFVKSTYIYLGRYGRPSSRCTRASPKLEMRTSVHF